MEKEQNESFSSHAKHVYAIAVKVHVTIRATLDHNEKNQKLKLNRCFIFIFNE